MKFVTIKIFAVSMLCVFLVAGGSARAEERYSEWGGGDEKYDALVDRLHELIDAAEKSRAADPILLRDLRNAIAEHTAAAPKAEPAPTLPSQKLVHDDFGDGNFTRNPAWTVVEGRFTVDSGLGLRSVVAKVAPAAQQTTQQSRTELVTDVLGSLLGSKKKKAAEPAPSQPVQPERVEIFLQTPISNAFQVVLEIVSREKHGRFSMDLFQGRSRSAGYRLAYVPGGQPSLELQRFGSSGLRSIGAYNQALNLEDNFRHRVEFSRDSDGVMKISVDGGVLFSVTDVSFRDPFAGLTIANEGGDYSLREIIVLGNR